MGSFTHLVYQVLAAAFGVAFVLNGWKLMRHSRDGENTLPKWMKVDARLRKPLAIANGVLTMLLGVALLVVLAYSRLREIAKSP